jgi:hypothetical protein
MISYLFEAVLLLALVATSVQVAIMYRQLRRLRAYDGDYRRILRDTGAALESIDGAVRDINAHGSQIILTLGERIEEAETLIARMEAAMEGVGAPRERLDAASQRPVLAWSAPEPARPAYQPRPAQAPRAAPEAAARPRFDPAVDMRPQAYAAPLPRPPMPAAARASSPEGTLGDYLGRWKPPVGGGHRSAFQGGRS